MCIYMCLYLLYSIYVSLYICYLCIYMCIYCKTLGKVDTHTTSEHNGEHIPEFRFPAIKPRSEETC